MQNLRKIHQWVFIILLVKVHYPLGFYKTEETILCWAFACKQLPCLSLNRLISSRGTKGSLGFVFPLRVGSRSCPVLFWRISRMPVTSVSVLFWVSTSLLITMCQFARRRYSGQWVYAVSSLHSGNPNKESE